MDTHDIYGNDVNQYEAEHHSEARDAALRYLQATKRGRGRPLKVILNPFVGHIRHELDAHKGGPWVTYPAFAMDIVEGVARLDWHDRAASKGTVGPSGTIDPTHKEPAGTSKPLSVKKLMRIISGVHPVSAATVQEHLRMGLRQSQRYVKAIELAMPLLMENRPLWLRERMEEGPRAKELKPWMSWEDQTGTTPNPEDLAKLRDDLTTLGTAAEEEWWPIT
ncbi:hypothetical protein [Pseudomonas mosselii]|uniref:hypothetical protein n=1 Tax=Pseudomonas mosselii TaxID=78327 RepID=UPI001F19CE2F|nr:hypothetical protein [Pseudomonas mosselii]